MTENKKLISQLKEALVYEERALVESQYACYKKLPGKLNHKELEETRRILEILLLQSLNHAHLLGELIVKYYGKSFGKF